MSVLGGHRPASGGSPVNLDTNKEPIGWGSNGALTTITSSATPNALGATSATLGTTANAWAGFYIYVNQPSGPFDYYQVDLSFDGGATWPVLGLHYEPSNTASVAPIRLPIKVSAGADVRARLRASSPSLTLRVALEGIIRTAASPPCFTSLVPLNINTAATGVATTVTLVHATAWTLTITSTVADYGGLLVMYGSHTSGATPNDSQYAAALVGIGASGSEVEVSRDAVYLIASGNSIRAVGCGVVEKAIPAGTRIASAVRAAVADGTTDRIGIGVYGLVA